MWVSILKELKQLNTVTLLVPSAVCSGHLSLQHLQEGVADLDDLPDVAEEDGGLDPLLLQQVGGVQGEGLGGGWRRSRQGRADWIQGCTSIPSTFGAG